jgi:amino acid transporter
MGFRDVLLYLLITSFSIQSLAIGAGAGPSAVGIRLIACLTFFVPLVCSVLELSSRYPQEGGIYVWSRRAFGDFAGFMTGWMYWACIAPFLPTLFYFIAANALFIGGARFTHLSASPAYFIGASLGCLALVTALNLVGLDIGKWLHNVGAAAEWLLAVLVVVAGGVAWAIRGPATAMPASSFVPSFDLKQVFFWATTVFAFTGIEAASILGGEIRDARRTLPRALLVAGVIITAASLLCTVGLLLVIPAGDISRMQGLLQALEAVGRRVGLSGLTPVLAGLLTIVFLGRIAAWLNVAARLPFVAGVDRFLPAAFARVHPRWRTPYVAILVQAAVTVPVLLLGQAGTSVAGAYDVLVSMSLIPTLIPFLYLFAAVIKLQREPAGPAVMRAPGGTPAAIFLAGLGFATTVVAIVFSVVPADGAAGGWLAVTKVVGLALLLVGTGVLVYVVGKRSAPRRAALAP